MGNLNIASKEDLKRITGFSRRSDQAKFLTHLGVPHIVNGHQELVVLSDNLYSALGGTNKEEHKPKPKPKGPNFDALK